MVGHPLIIAQREGNSHTIICQIRCSNTIKFHPWSSNVYPRRNIWHAETVVDVKLISGRDICAQTPFRRLSIVRTTAGKGGGGGGERSLETAVVSANYIWIGTAPNFSQHQYNLGRKCGRRQAMRMSLMLPYQEALSRVLRALQRHMKPVLTALKVLLVGDLASGPFEWRYRGFSRAHCYADLVSTYYRS